MKGDPAHASVLLAGGTSQVGVFALQQLSVAVGSIFSVSRRVPGGPDQPTGYTIRNVHWIHSPGSLTLQDDREPLSARVEYLLSCGPVHLAAKLVPECPRLVRVVCVSSSSVYTKADSRDRDERELIGGILAAEDNLRALCAERKIRLVILRPTMIYGCGLDHNVSRLARWIRRLHFLPVAGQASGLRQPIHAEDVASIAVRALLGGALDGNDVVLKGGSTISYREMVERIFRALGLKPRILTLPPALLAAALRAASYFPGCRGVNAEFALRQNKDLVFDGAPDDPGWTARPFEPTRADFEVPEAARALQPGALGLITR